MAGINISLKPEVVAQIGDFPITNAMISMIFVVLFLGILFLFINAKKTRVPGKIQLIMEMYLDTMYKFVRSTTGSDKQTKVLFPIFVTMVTALLACNLMGLLPIWGPVSINEVALWRPPTADFNFVLGLAIFMFFLWQIAGLISAGPISFIKRYINWSSPIGFFVGLLDIIGELAKVMSISFRLFGNIFAGEAIAAVMGGLVPVVAPVPFAFLGLMGSLVQAFVFPVLVLLFMTMSIESEDAADELEHLSDPVASQKQQDQKSNVPEGMVASEKAS